MQVSNFSPVGFLSRSSDGYVRWKGTVVDHYSYSDRDAERKALERLALRCQSLEDRGLPVTGRTVVWSKELFESTPGVTEWLPAMTRYYTLVQGNGRRAAIFYSLVCDSAVIVERTAEDSISLRFRPWGHEALALLEREGVAGNVPKNSYEQFVAFFTEAGLTPQDIDRALDTRPGNQLQ